MATQLGKPAVTDPRELTLREVQQVISNIRQRLAALDSTLSTVQQLQNVGRQSTATDLTSLQRQIDNLQQALAALTVIVNGLSTGGADTDPRVEQLAGELMALQQLLGQLGDPDPGRQPQIEAALAELQRQVDAIDTVGDTASHAALLQRLQAQVDDLERSILV